MEKNYKVITIFSIGEIHIDHYKTLEAAIAEYNKAAENGCETCYLVETKIHFQCSGDSFNKIMSTYFRKNN